MSTEVEREKRGSLPEERKMERDAEERDGESGR
jgi:hypothetical protein